MGILGRVLGEGVTGSGRGGGIDGLSTKVGSKTKLTCFAGVESERVSRVATGGKDAGRGDGSRVTGGSSGKGTASSCTASTILGATGV